MESEEFRYTEKKCGCASREGGDDWIGTTRSMSGDRVSWNGRSPGANIEAGKSFGPGESVKAVSEILRQRGRGVESERELHNTPEKQSIPHRPACVAWS